MIEKQRIIDIVEEHLKDSDLFLIEVKVSGRNKIMIFLDGDNGVPISSCVQVSRHVESQFDRDVEDFELDVSSVGVDSALRMPRQFIKNIGREIAFEDSEGRKVKAKLLNAGDAGFTIEKQLPKKKKKDAPQEDPVQTLSYEAAKDVKVQVSFKKSSNE